jgi:hypothetical protein
MTPDQSRRYGALMQAVNTQAALFTTSGVPADIAAKVIAKAITARKPRTRYTVGRDAALITCLARILPDRILDLLFASALRPHVPKDLDSASARRKSAVGTHARPVAGSFYVPRGRPRCRRGASSLTMLASRSRRRASSSLASWAITSSLSASAALPRALASSSSTWSSGLTRAS